MPPPGIESDFFDFGTTTPGESLRLLEELQPDGRLLDVNLKARLTGFDILARAEDLSPSTKVIMVTGGNDLESIEKAMELGAVDYITKPFTVEYLEATVNAKIATHLIDVRLTSLGAGSLGGRSLRFPILR